MNREKGVFFRKLIMIFVVNWSYIAGYHDVIQTVVVITEPSVEHERIPLSGDSLRSSVCSRRARLRGLVQCIRLLSSAKGLC